MRRVGTQVLCLTVAGSTVRSNETALIGVPNKFFSLFDVIPISEAEGRPFD